jgi:hypothetical protein
MMSAFEKVLARDECMRLTGQVIVQQDNPHHS